MIRAALSVAALMLAVPAFAQAPDSATLASAEKLIEATKIIEQLDQMFTMLAPTMAKAGIAQMAAGDATRPLYDQLTKGDYGRKVRLEEILAEEFLAAMRASLPRMKREYAREYATTFSKADLDTLTAFFAAGAGAKYIAETPGLNTRLAAVGERIGIEARLVAAPKALQRAETELDAVK